MPNTPFHGVSTFWLLRRRAYAGAATLAALTPDLPYYLAFLWGCLRYLPGVGNGRSLHAAMVDAVLETWSNSLANAVAQRVTHSLLLVTLASLAALLSRRPLLKAVACGWALHVVADLGLHVTDAYPVLWPASLRVFPAPLSYWDPRHGGRIGAGVLAVSSAALWGWLAVSFGRGRFISERWRGHVRQWAVTGAAALFALLGLGELVPALAGFGPPGGRTGAAADLDLQESLAKVALLVDQGSADQALVDLDALPPAAPAQRMHAPEAARRMLLRGYALDLLGRRDEAVQAYRGAETLEPEGDVGDKARRYQGEPFREVPDPRVSSGWALLFTWGLLLSLALVRSLPFTAPPP